MMHTPFVTAVRAAILLAGCSMTAVQAAPADDEVKTLVQRFTAAQSGFDAATLKTLTADNYIEISPLGEVDPREKMLSFYVKKDDKPRPEIGVDELSTRVLGDSAVTIGRTFYAMNAGGQNRTFSLRSVFVSAKQGGTWKLVSVQYTPIRQAAKP